MGLAFEDFPTAEELRKACAQLPGLMVLDVTPDNIKDHCCGSFDLVERDLNAVLPERLAQQALETLRQAGVPQALRVRNELVSYKKVALHLHHQGVLLERKLLQLATFFRESQWDEGRGFYVHSATRAELSRVRTRCKGRCEATYDARVIGRWLCGLPRHPDVARPANLAQLPRSLRCWGLGAGGLGQLGRPAAEDLDTSPGGPSWHQRALDAIAALPWPEHLREFVRLDCVCRGADKALRIRDELCRVLRALRLALAQAEEALEGVAAEPSPDDLVDGDDVGGEEEDAGDPQSGERAAAGDPEDPRARMARAIRLRKHFNLLSGSLPFLREAVRWLAAIDDAAATDCGRLFVAGDARLDDGRPAALCVPSGFGVKDEDEGFQRVAARYAEEMRSVLAASGWPAHVAERRGGGRAEGKPCGPCGRRFAPLWMHRDVCCECEDASRASGRCPYSARCAAAWFCPHARRCLVCDAHSCEECRLLRGDGEFVLDFAAQTRPARIALDFDRTLATTRTGASPIAGTHSVDPDLLSLLVQYGKACVVITRNSHTEAIRTFLAAHGAPEEVEVFTVKRPRSKAEILIPSLRPEDKAIFVDDSVAELVDPLVAKDPRVQRVLFVRALL